MKKEVYNYKLSEPRHLDLLMIPSKIHVELPSCSDLPEFDSDHNYSMPQNSSTNVFKKLGLIDGSLRPSAQSSKASEKK